MEALSAKVWLYGLSASLQSDLPTPLWGTPMSTWLGLSSSVFTFLRGSFQYPGRQRLSYQCSGNQMKDEREEVSAFSLWNAYVHPLFSNCMNFYLNFKTSREPQLYLPPLSPLWKVPGWAAYPAAWWERSLAISSETAFHQLGFFLSPFHLALEALILLNLECFEYWVFCSLNWVFCSINWVSFQLYPELA